MHGIYFLGELEPASKCIKAYCIVIAGYRFLCELDCTIKMLIIPHLFEATLENNDRDIFPALLSPSTEYLLSCVSLQESNWSE